MGANRPWYGPASRIGKRSKFLPEIFTPSVCCSIRSAESSRARDRSGCGSVMTRLTLRYRCERSCNGELSCSGYCGSKNNLLLRQQLLGAAQFRTRGIRSRAIFHQERVVCRGRALLSALLSGASRAIEAVEAIWIEFQIRFIFRERLHGTLRFQQDFGDHLAH